MVDSATGMLTVKDVAVELDRSIEQVRRYIREGRLPARKIGMQWFVASDSLAGFDSRRSSRGQAMTDWLGRVAEVRETIRAGSGLLTEDEFVELIDSGRQDLL